MNHSAIVDFDTPLPFWFCLLMMAALGTLIRIVISGFDRTVPLTRASRVIRIAGGGVWALMIAAVMVFQVVKALR